MVRSSWVAFSWHFLAFGLSWVFLHFLESVFSAGLIPFIWDGMVIWEHCRRWGWDRIEKIALGLEYH
jgi:hypothetical protein